MRPALHPIAEPRPLGLANSHGVRMDAAADERRQQPLAQLVGDLPLIERQHLEPHPQRRRAVGERFDAEDLERRP